MRRVCGDLAWLRRLFNELDVLDINLIPLKCDNMTSIYIASNPIFHERTKHIEIDCHFVRGKVTAGLIQMDHVLQMIRKLMFLLNNFMLMQDPSLVCVITHKLDDRGGG